MVRRAMKIEDELVQRYKKWLAGKYRTLVVARYGRLRCDAYDTERCNLIEAKASTKREYIRMAVGQLLDYAYLGREEFGTPHMAILVPTRPNPNSLHWLSELNISVIWVKARGFVDNAGGQFT